MFSSRTSIATLAVLALTSAGGAVTSTPATATSPRSDYCTNSGSTHLPQSADTAATWLAACHCRRPDRSRPTPAVLLHPRLRAVHPALGRCHRRVAQCL